MTTEEVAHRLITYCRKNDFEAAQKELFDSNAISIEPEASAGFQKETKGLKAILQKGKKWTDMQEKAGSCIVTEPLIAGNSFAVQLSMDVSMKGKGQMVIQELCVYKVKDGKIIAEQFFM
jgi:hypothetical protein